MFFTKLVFLSQILHIRIKDLSYYSLLRLDSLWLVGFNYFNMQDVNQLTITARQYGEVVLPDESIRAGSWYFSHKAVTVQGGYGACFCRPGTNFIEHYECRGTSL